MNAEPITKRRRAQEIALLMATAVIPRSFQRSLLDRSTTDQGVVTGLTVVTVYLLGLVAQDGVETVAGVISPEQDDGTSGNTVNKTVFFSSLAAIGVGLLAEELNRYDKDEKLSRSAVRTGGYWLRNAGVAGLMHSAVVATNEAVSDDKTAAKQRDLLPYFMAIGVLYTLAGEYLQARNGTDFSLKDSLVASKPVRAVGVGFGVAAALGGVAYAERSIARRVDDSIESIAPRLKSSWLPVGHIVGAGVLAGGLYALLRRTYGKIEHGAGVLETGFKMAPESPLLSGGPHSLIAWDSLSLQGRRHIGTALSATQIKQVMQDNAKEPIRVYVGLDSASTEEERTELALAELERTGAYGRDVLLVVSPTGTGYVNYVMSEAVEYLTRGDVASVTLQYSKRPSPLSLDRVDEGHIQYRMLLNGIRKKLASLPANAHRPRIVLFGESLGAWTSQDALMYQGTDGLRALDVDRALWIGTPKGSKWKEQIASNKFLNTDKELIGVFDSYDDVLRLSPVADARSDTYC